MVILQNQIFLPKFSVTTTMWAPTVSFPSPLRANPPMNYRNHRSLKLRASLYNYPLASKIMVKNLPYSTEESSLQKEFSKFGQVAEVKLVKDEFTKRSKGYAFIQYTSQDDAILALENMDQKIFDGRLIYVEIAKLRKERFHVDPKTSGPPKKQSQHEDEVADCWY